ncbi:MAG: hypothetical protein CL920_13660 [Deltaproteobacteria bacterium]|nr:hypothetical protein [Deltaproteobacteria bacterium]MBU49737.1 hypothetical protein [Deltaproteobacteria bacterium]
MSKIVKGILWVGVVLSVCVWIFRPHRIVIENATASTLHRVFYSLDRAKKYRHPLGSIAPGEQKSLWFPLMSDAESNLYVRVDGRFYKVVSCDYYVALFKLIGVTDHRIKFVADISSAKTPFYMVESGGGSTPTLSKGLDTSFCGASLSHIEGDKAIQGTLKRMSLHDKRSWIRYEAADILRALKKNRRLRQVRKKSARKRRLFSIQQPHAKVRRRAL